MQVGELFCVENTYSVVVTAWELHLLVAYNCVAKITCVFPYDTWEPASSDRHGGWQFSSRAALLPACIHSSWASIITIDYWDEDKESITSLSHNEFNISQDNEHLTNSWLYKWCNTVHNLLTYEKNKIYTQVYDFFVGDNTSHLYKAQKTKKKSICTCKGFYAGFFSLISHS